MFQQALKAFLPNEQNKDMFPIFVCFFIAALGFVIGFSNADTPHMWVRVAAAAMVVLGVLVGSCVVLYKFVWRVWRLIRTLSGKP